VPELFADWRVRLDDYLIDTISIASYRGQGFTFTVVFSVKPTHRFTDWAAGNGLIRTDGWIERKFLFVTVFQAGGEYQIEGMGTGP
jgi:hypothetical protein